VTLLELTIGALQPYECAVMVSMASARRDTPVTSASFLHLAWERNHGDVTLQWS
jgi:hypothetical protein